MTIITLVRMLVAQCIAGITMDRTSRNDLDIFILALVKSGLATPYDFKVRAGLSVGSTTPVLKRLKKAGLISASKRGARNSRKFELTDSGRQAIESNWRHVIESPTDFDSMLRIIYLSWLLGSKDIVSKSINKSISTLEDQAGLRDAEAKQVRSKGGDVVTGESFRWIRAYVGAAQGRAQAKALAQIEKIIIHKQTK